MKREKGFTLVELLAVIVILGLLAAIVIPAYNTIKKKAATEMYNNKVEMIKAAAYKYGNDNVNDVAANPTDYINIPIATFITTGYLASDSKTENILINPLTNEAISETITIIYVDNKITVNLGALNEFALIINLNGGISNVYNTTLVFSMEENETMEIISPTKARYNFTGWNYNGTSGNFDAVTNIFTMGTGNVVLEATWELSDNLLPKMVLNIENGTVYSKTKEATITLEDEGDSRLKGGTYKILYKWSMTEPACSEMTDYVDIWVDVNGVSEVKNITISEGTGPGNLYVCNDSIIYDNANNSLVNNIENINMYLDNEPPTCQINPPPLASFNSTITMIASDNVELASEAYSWIAADSGYSTTNTKTGAKEVATYKAWVKDAVGNVGACQLSCGSFTQVEYDTTSGYCSGGSGMNYYSECIQWTSSSKCCTRSGHYRCGTKSGCYSDKRWQRICTSKTVNP